MSLLAKINRSPALTEDWRWLKGWTCREQDQRSIALTEIDIEKVCLRSVFCKGELFIDGQTYLGRIRLSSRVSLDIAFFKMFWQNKQMIPEIWKRNGIIITFAGTVLYNSLGVPSILTMWWCDIEDKWFCDLCWLGREFTAKHLSVVLTPD